MVLLLPRRLQTIVWLAPAARSGVFQPTVLWQAETATCERSRARAEADKP